MELWDHPFKLVLFGGEGCYIISSKYFSKIPQYKINFKVFSNIQTDKYQVEMLLSKCLCPATTKFKHVQKKPLL